MLNHEFLQGSLPLPLTCIHYLHIEDNVKFKFGGKESNYAYLLALIANVFIL